VRLSWLLWIGRLLRSPAVVALLVLSGCSSSAPTTSVVAVATATPSPHLAVSNPNHATLPGDESPHGDLTEWWYYTGHLAAADGRHYGFELVFFQSRRGDTPPGYAAHFALTDDRRKTFHFDHRSGSGEQGGTGAGFDLHLGEWSAQGARGRDKLTATMTDYAIDLDASAVKPAALHRGSGLIDFGDFGRSYYYSRTRIVVTGTVRDHGQAVAVTGLAWMDHQWGNFIVGSVGGWDWYSIQLDNGTDVMLSVNRGADNKQYLSYGTYVPPSGPAVDLPAGSFTTQATGSWTSPATGITYPSGWQVALPSEHLTLSLEPTVQDQELDLSSASQPIYWEGEVTVTGTDGSKSVAGQGYVELTGYGQPR